MTPDELKKLLGDRDVVKARPFELLKEIASIFNQKEGNEDLCRDLVFRALEVRDTFGACQVILEDLVRELGLFPYLDREKLSLTDAIAYECHRPENLPEAIVFHREQADVYRKLIDGDNIILSAPTSFGKSKIIDAIIASGRYNNIVLIVPTIALIDETRRRVSSFTGSYKIVTQVTQVAGERNIFVFTAERANVYQDLPPIDFFAIDEFYKIGAVASDPKRTVALNHAFYRLLRGGGQFYLLGPSIREIPTGLEEHLRCRFYPTTYATVASEVIRVNAGSDDISALCALVRDLKGEPTLIFCKSPKSTNDVANALLDADATTTQSEVEVAATWMEHNFHKEWVLPRALRRGIGMHHGKLPRSLGQFVVRAFNDERLSTLVCTSTLIEGVNTKAKNVIIYDNTIARKSLDFFTFNNIKGRSGRMFEHFVGRVFLFHEPPTEDLPIVDFPIFTQKEGTPDSILMQLEDEDLLPSSKERVEPLFQQTDLPVEMFRRHGSIEPDHLLSLARALKQLGRGERQGLSWSGFPRWERLKQVCNLAWLHLVDQRQRAGVASGNQLALKVSRLRQKPDIRERILDELIPNRFAASSVDEAVERVLEFERTWASFELPRILRAFSDIRKHVLGGPGDYSYFASQLEKLFRPGFQIALEEFGLPVQVSDKLAPRLGEIESIDEALQRLRMLDARALPLDDFERELLSECQHSL